MPSDALVATLRAAGCVYAEDEARVLTEAATDDAELAAIRDSLRGGRPYGRPDWAQETARGLGLAWERRPRGRPRKSEK